MPFWYPRRVKFALAVLCQLSHRSSLREFFPGFALRIHDRAGHFGFSIWNVLEDNIKVKESKYFTALFKTILLESLWKQVQKKLLLCASLRTFRTKIENYQGGLQYDINDLSGVRSRKIG